MKFVFVSLFFLFGFFSLEAQGLLIPERDSLTQKENLLQPLSDQIVNASDQGERTEACNAFVPMLVSALRIKGSFSFPFDSLKTISILYPRDSSFRIFTWQLSRGRGDNVYFGAIQIRTKDGKLKLFPLLDYSGITEHFADTITSNLKWMGALYYNMVEKTYRGKKYYTLFGFNGNGLLFVRKLLEVLTFLHGKPVFGAPVFSYASNSHPRIRHNRFILQYKWNGDARLNYDPGMHMIIYDHLVSLSNEPWKVYTLVPDGTYEAFRWENGVWQHFSNPFGGPAKKVSVPKPLHLKQNNLGN